MSTLELESLVRLAVKVESWVWLLLDGSAHALFCRSTHLKANRNVIIYSTPKLPLYTRIRFYTTLQAQWKCLYIGKCRKAYAFIHDLYTVLCVGVGIANVVSWMRAAAQPNRGHTRVCVFDFSRYTPWLRARNRRARWRESIARANKVACRFLWHCVHANANTSASTQCGCAFLVWVYVTVCVHVF